MIREKMVLPRLFVVKSNCNDKYLRYIHEDGQAHGFLQFSEEEFANPYVKYEMEMAKSGNGLVHIRSCYNNKYWVRSSAKHSWIVAGADEPEEDQSKWSCTLFEPVLVEDDKTFRLRHVQLGKYACLWRADPAYNSCLFAGSSEPDKDQCYVFTITNWESYLILPKQVAFKGDNEKYLCANTIKENNYLQFVSTDLGDTKVRNEVFTNCDGSVRLKLKSDNFVQSWMRNNDNWISTSSEDSNYNAEDSTNNPNKLFWPIKVSNNVVALLNLGNNNYCKRDTRERKTKCLKANAPTKSPDAYLKVEEPIKIRKIHGVSFHLMDARIYNKNIVTMATTTVKNKTGDPKSEEVNLPYIETKSRTWNAHLSLQLGVKSEIQSGVPLIQAGTIKILENFNAPSYSWGETDTVKNEITAVENVTVPPMTKVTVSLQATICSYDVPFSYSQSDELYNGQTNTYELHDGVYTGINPFNFEIKVIKNERL